MKNLDDDAFEELAHYFGALSTPIRLKILTALREGERNVSELTAITACTQANVSKHLGVLLQAAIVGKTQRGTSVYYRIVDPRIYKLCELVCGQIGERYGEMAERRRLFERAAGRHR